MSRSQSWRPPAMDSLSRKLPRFLVDMDTERYERCQELWDKIAHLPVDKVPSKSEALAALSAWAAGQGEEQPATDAIRKVIAECTSGGRALTGYALRKEVLSVFEDLRLPEPWEAERKKLEDAFAD